MRKEFEQLLAMRNGYLRINKLAILHRWQEDALGDDVDGLEIIFNSPTGRASFYTRDIKARDAEGIAKEIATHIKAFAEKWAREEAIRVLAGRIDGKCPVAKGAEYAE